MRAINKRRKRIGLAAHGEVQAPPGGTTDLRAGAAVSQQVRVVQTPDHPEDDTLHDIPDERAESHLPRVAFLRFPEVPSRAVVDPGLSTIAELEKQLAHYRASRESLLDGLRKTEEISAALCARIDGMAARRKNLEAKALAQADIIAQLHSKLGDFERREDELARSLHVARQRQATLEKILKKRRAAQADLDAAIRLLEAALSKSAARALKAEEDWFTLYAEFEELRARNVELSATVADHTASLEARDEALNLAQSKHASNAERSMRLIEAAEASGREAWSRIRNLESRIHELEASVSEGSAYVSDLLGQIQNKDQQILQTGLYVRRLEAQLSQRESELEAVRKAALADKLLMREYVQSLQEQVAQVPALREAQNQLAVQTEGLIESLQAESAQLVNLINTVQSSHFWRLKRVVNRVRTRVLRR